MYQGTGCIAGADLSYRVLGYPDLVFLFKYFSFAVNRGVQVVLNAFTQLTPTPCNPPKLYKCLYRIYRPHVIPSLRSRARFFFLGIDTGRNPAAIILYADGIVFVNINGDVLQ
jgi:hypothetical protein